MPTIVEIITAIAQELGVPPILAVADAQVESGLNPLAVGDQGTSFGLFQLHEGGELGNLTPQQAFDPTTNASVALREFALVEQQHPGLDPGWIAALAERPADQPGYAAKVDAAIRQLETQGYPASGLAPSVTGAAQLLGTGPLGLPTPGDVAGGLAAAVQQGMTAAASTIAGAVGTGVGLGANVALTTVGHGLANAATTTFRNAETFAARNLIALVVAAIVVVVLFT